MNILKDYLGDKKEWASVVIGVVISGISLFATSKSKIPMNILVIAIIIFLLIFWRMWITIEKLKNEPKVIIPIRWHNHRQYGNLLIIDKYDFLSPNAYVTLYINNFVEEYYGTGIILCEQTSNGKFMVRLLQVSKFYEENNPTVLLPEPNVIIIKPIITNHFFEEELS